jgi:outer membrane receptor protein involved in Fe transport
MLVQLRNTTLALTVGAAALGAVALPLHAAPVVLAQAAPATNSSSSAATSSWLSLGQIHDKLQADGYTDIREIERERGGYEAKARDRDGRWMKLYIEPLGGKVVDQRVREERRDERREQRHDD